MNRLRWLVLLLLLPLLLAAQELPQARSARVYWEPLPAGWKAWYVAGADSQPIVGEAAELRAGRHIVLNSGAADIGRIVIEIRLSDRDIRSLDRFAAEFAGHGLASVYRYAETRLAGVDAFHAAPDAALKRYQDWLLLLDLPGGRPWIAMQATCAHSPGKPGYEECERRAAEQARILAGLSFDRPPPTGWRARIEVPSDLKPGDELFPVAVIVDDEGRAPAGEVTLIWRFGGREGKSIVWDGQPLAIELDASVDGRGLAASLQLPRWDPTAPPPPPAPPAPLPPAAVPGLNGAGELPGPRNAAEGLVGTFGPAALGLLGALLSGLLAPPGQPPQKPPLRPRRATRRKGDERDKASQAEDTQEPADDDGKAPEEPRKQPPGGPQQPRRRSGSRAPAPDDPGTHVRERLEQLRRNAERSGHHELGAAIDRAIERSFDRDGRLDPESWKQAQAELKGVRDSAWRNLAAPTSLPGDLIRMGPYALGRGVLSGFEAAGGMLVGIGRIGVGAVKSVADFGDAIFHPGHFTRGASDAIGRWAERNAATEKRIIEEGLRQGRTGDALIGLAMGGVKAGIAAAKAVGGFVKREILPWEEIESLADSQASLEERLWAVPAAAAKIAGLLAMGQRPGTQPSTRWGKAIHDALDRRAAAAAAAAQARTAATTAAGPAPPVARAGATANVPPAARPTAASAPRQRPDLRKLWSQGADGSDVQQIIERGPSVSGHDAVFGDQSIEAKLRAEHYRFLNVDRRGVHLLEPLAGVEDRCDALLPKIPLSKLTLRDIIVRADDPVRARFIRDQLWRRIRKVVDG